MSDQTQEVNGHPVAYRAHRFECLACGARLMSIMQFQDRECSGDPAVRVHLRRARSAEAAIHGRWHRALDDLSSEPDGPIRDHIEQHDARVRRDLAAKVEAFHEAELERLRQTWPEPLRRPMLGNYLGGIKAAWKVLADALPQDADSEPASVPLAAEDGSGAAVDVPGAAGLSEGQGGVTACHYGAHDFVLGTPDASPIGAPAGMHLHVCANCGATYYQHGGGPCWRCRRVDAKTRDGGAGL